MNNQIHMNIDQYYPMNDQNPGEQNLFIPNLLGDQDLQPINFNNQNQSSRDQFSMPILPGGQDFPSIPGDQDLSYIPDGQEIPSFLNLPGDQDLPSIPGDQDLSYIPGDQNLYFPNIPYGQYLPSIQNLPGNQNLFPVLNQGLIPGGQDLPSILNFPGDQDLSSIPGDQDLITPNKKRKKSGNQDLPSFPGDIEPPKKKKRSNYENGLIDTIKHENIKVENGEFMVMREDHVAFWKYYFSRSATSKAGKDLNLFKQLAKDALKHRRINVGSCFGNETIICFLNKYCT